jgi:hypothetical protein
MGYWILFVLGTASATVLVAGTIARPWLVRRGFLFPRGEKGKRSHAAMGVAAIFKPEMEHVIEEEQSQAIIREDAETGESLRLDLE